MKMITQIFIYMTLFVCFTIPVNAAMFHWVDDDGVSHFSNVAPPDKVKIEKKAEVKSKYIPQSTKPSTSDSAINRYKKALLHYQKTSPVQTRQDAPSKTTKSSSSGMHDYYKMMVEKYERRVETCKEDLDEVKREAYKDPQWHRKKVQRRENRLADVKAELERYKKKYSETK